AYVPIDDTHHNHFMSIAITATWLPKTLSKLVFGNHILQWFYALRSGSRDERFSKKSREGLSGRRTFDRITNHKPRFQDTLICVGQGEIANRSAGSAERLGRTDAAVILLRKIWKRELRLLAEGKPLTQFTFPQFTEASGAIAGLELVKHVDPL